MGPCAVGSHAAGVHGRWIRELPSSPQESSLEAHFETSEYAAGSAMVQVCLALLAVGFRHGNETILNLKEALKPMRGSVATLIGFLSASSCASVPVQSIYLSMQTWLIGPGSMTIKELAVEKDEIWNVTL